MHGESWPGRCLANADGGFCLPTSINKNKHNIAIAQSSRQASTPPWLPPMRAAISLATVTCWTWDAARVHTDAGCGRMRRLSRGSGSMALRTRGGIYGRARPLRRLGGRAASIRAAAALGSGDVFGGRRAPASQPRAPICSQSRLATAAGHRALLLGQSRADRPPPCQLPVAPVRAVRAGPVRLPHRRAPNGPPACNAQACARPARKLLVALAQPADVLAPVRALEQARLCADNARARTSRPRTCA